MTQSELFSGEMKKICVCDVVSFDIDPNHLFCRKFQKVVLKGKGIPIINEKNVFDDSVKGDVIVNINTV